MEIYYFPRELELINIQIIFSILMILFINLVFRAYRQGDVLAGIYKIGLAGFFFCNAMNFVFRFLDLYYPSYLHIELLIYSRIFIMISVTFLLASLELSKMLETKGFLTLSFAVFTVIINIIAPSSPIVTVISSFIHIIIPVLYFYFTIREKGIIRYQIFFNGLGILLILIGSTLRPSDFRTIFPNVIRSLETVLSVPFEIYPFVLVYLGFLLIMVFEVDFKSKLQWLNKVNLVYLINSAGKVILEKSLKGELIPFENLAERGINVVGLLKEIKEKKLLFKKQGGRRIFIACGNETIGIAIAEENYKIISRKLLEFTKDFEQLFQDILPKWDGTDLRLFKPAHILLERHFSMED